MRSRGPLLLSILFFFLLLAVEAAYLYGLDIEITPSAIGQGEVRMLSIQKKREDRPKVTWMGKKIILVSDKENETWSGFIGADLTTSPGRYKLLLSRASDNDPHSITISVVPRDYGIRLLTLPKEMVELDINTLKRVKEESRRMMELFTGPADYSLWRGRWIRPVEGTVVSPFGSRRMINEMERSPHSGVDLKAPEGTPVKATNNGKVALVEDHFFSGLSVVIDHGGGIQSMYFHLSKVFVQVGQLIGRGAAIGLSGSSGRVTGPHLHFGIRLNGERVNPIKLIEVSGRLER